MKILGEGEHRQRDKQQGDEKIYTKSSGKNCLLSFDTTQTACR
jgi:hypothetical protein